MTASLSDLARFFDASTNPYLMLDRDLNIAAANQAYLASVNRTLPDVEVCGFDAHLRHTRPLQRCRFPREEGVRLLELSRTDRLAEMNAWQLSGT